MKIQNLEKTYQILIYIKVEDFQHQKCMVIKNKRFLGESSSFGCIIY